MIFLVLSRPLAWYIYPGSECVKLLVQVQPYVVALYLGGNRWSWTLQPFLRLCYRCGIRTRVLCGSHNLRPNPLLGTSLRVAAHSNELALTPTKSDSVVSVTRVNWAERY